MHKFRGKEAVPCPTIAYKGTETGRDVTHLGPLVPLVDAPAKRIADFEAPTRSIEPLGCRELGFRVTRTGSTCLCGIKAWPAAEP